MKETSIPWKRAALSLGERAVFALDGDDLWVGDGILPIRYNHREDRLKDVPWPPNVDSPILSIAASKSHVWFGTRNHGLVEIKKETGTLRIYQKSDGLLLPKLTSLLTTADRLWLGFGDPSMFSGGIGYLDLKSGKIVSLTTLEPSMYRGPYKTFNGPDLLDAPPRRPVISLGQTDSGLLWAAVPSKGLQRYDISTAKWSTANAIQNFDGAKMQAIPDDYLQLTGIAANGKLVAVGCVESSSTSSNRSRKGGLALYDPAANTWQTFATTNGLPADSIYSVAFDGQQLWCGCEDGRLARINLATRTVEKVFRLSGLDAAHNIQVDDESLWLAIRSQLFRLPKESLK